MILKRNSAELSNNNKYECNLHKISALIKVKQPTTLSRMTYKHRQNHLIKDQSHQLQPNNHQKYSLLQVRVLLNLMQNCIFYQENGDIFNEPLSKLFLIGKIAITWFLLKENLLRRDEHLFRASKLYFYLFIKDGIKKEKLIYRLLEHRSLQPLIVG